MSEVPEKKPGKREAEGFGYASTSGSEAEGREAGTGKGRNIVLTPNSNVADSSAPATPKAATTVMPSDEAIRQAQINMEQHVRTLDAAVALHHARKLTNVNMTHYKQAMEGSSSSGEEWSGDTDQSAGVGEDAHQDEDGKGVKIEDDGEGSDEGNGLQELDVALGHLSIQENGRSRYVGGSFWALLSSEVSSQNPRKIGNII